MFVLLTDTHLLIMNIECFFFHHPFFFCSNFNNVFTQTTKKKKSHTYTHQNKKICSMFFLYCYHIFPYLCCWIRCYLNQSIVNEKLEWNSKYKTQSIQNRCNLNDNSKKNRMNNQYVCNPLCVRVSCFKWIVTRVIYI